MSIIEPGAEEEAGRARPENSNLFLASIAISLKRIADLLEETDTDRRIEVASKMLEDV